MTSAPASVAAKANSAQASRVTEQTALTKKMPDNIHPNKKQIDIVANANVGWGNAIYVRGDGGGLSWDEGEPMLCVADDQWVWSYPEADAPREFKFLRNDRDWAFGDNHKVAVEKMSVFTPQFS
jgi:hypothetical protein